MGQAQWVLEAVEGEYTGRRFGVTERGITLGREADNDLVLLDDNISRHHALVRISDGRPLIEDRNSRNGTFVNNQRVSRLRLAEGDRIAVGSHLFVMRRLSETEEAPEDTDAERTVIARPTPAQLRKTQAVQLFSPEAMAYRRRKEQQDLAALGPRPSSRDPIVTADDEKSGPILGGAAASTGQPATQKPDPIALPQIPATETVDEDMKTVLLRSGNSEPRAQEAPDPNLSHRPVDAAGDSMSDAAPVAPELPPPEDLGEEPPFEVPEAKSGSPARRLAIVGGGIAGGLILLMALYSHFSQPTEIVTAASHPTPAATSTANDAAAMFQFDDRTSSAVRSSVGLTEEEKALPEEERVSLANEHFDQGERYMESNKLNAALEEFEKALALNPDCKVCVIRVAKVEAAIRKEIEKYKSDALRAYQAMEYDKAKRYWEMVLELERDPAGRRVALDGLRRAIKQLKKQSYR